MSSEQFDELARIGAEGVRQANVREAVEQLRAHEQLGKTGASSLHSPSPRSDRGDVKSSPSGRQAEQQEAGLSLPPPSPAGWSRSFKGEDVDREERRHESSRMPKNKTWKTDRAPRQYFVEPPAAEAPLSLAAVETAQIDFGGLLAQQTALPFVGRSDIWSRFAEHPSATTRSSR